jgi:hypothetical protein
MGANIPGWIPPRPVVTQATPPAPAKPQPKAVPKKPPASVDALAHPAPKPVVPAQLAAAGVKPYEWNNMKNFMGYLHGKDPSLTKAQISGIIGNFWQESFMDPTIAQGDSNNGPHHHGPNDPNPAGPGHGLAQWGGGNPDRWQQLLAFAKTQPGKPSPYDFKLQCDFMWHELKSPGYSSALSDLKTKTTPQDAAAAFCTDYEGPGIPDLPNRQSFAGLVDQAAPWPPAAWPPAPPPAEATPNQYVQAKINQLIKMNG